MSIETVLEEISALRNDIKTSQNCQEGQSKKTIQTGKGS